MTDLRFARLAYPGIANLGDAIQTLAASRFLPASSSLIDRETISQPQVHGPVRMILNGWFMHEPRFWPPHAAIEPLLISMHFAEPGKSRLRRWAKNPRDVMLTGAGAEFLRQWGPVGARDRVTLEALLAMDIPAYHSGCLTLTLRRAAPAVRHDHVVACDLPPMALERLRVLAAGRPVVETTHLGGELLSCEQQEAQAERLLQTYAGAAAVVTTRIHAALPCLAMGTPVLLLTAANGPRRITDMADLMHHCPIERFLKVGPDFDFAVPPANPDRHLLLADRLAARCRAFTGCDSAA